MTALAQKIAQEHRIETGGDFPYYSCVCGHTFDDDPYAEHIATVTMKEFHEYLATLALVDSYAFPDHGVGNYMARWIRDEDYEFSVYADPDPKSLHVGPLWEPPEDDDD